MLLEIYCDKFLENGNIRPAIEFHNGLNVVLGDELGANSIGKSTFLLVVDFIFGGDDYVKKPYSLAVLLAKVKIQMKKAEELRQLKTVENPPAAIIPEDQAVSSKNFALDEPTMSVIVKGERISLKAKEFALLKCLYEHKNTIVTKDALFEEVWGERYNIYS